MGICFFFHKFSKKAEKSMQYYKGCEGKTEKESLALLDEFEKLKSAVTVQKVDDKISFEEICEWP